MFLNSIKKYNNDLLETAITFHQNNSILPDSYVLDVDTFISNAKAILEEGNRNNIRLFFMLKQVGRNPYLARKLVDIGYPGAVVVDFYEAQLMMKHNIPICNVGHLVQPPKAMVKRLLDYGVEYFTVYSLDKIKEINKYAAQNNKVQKLLIRIVDDGDLLYSAQTAGFYLDELPKLFIELKKLRNVVAYGITSFPCFLYDGNIGNIRETANLQTVLKAKKIFSDYGLECKEINLPSSTCVENISELAKYGTSGEPGHGLSGTTPLHANRECVEKPCVVYVSEVSHNFAGQGFCYGGGNYRRGHIENALVVGKRRKEVTVIPPTDDSIDYHFGLSEECEINDTVIMAFRFQLFVTRSNLVLIEGIASKDPKIIGVYSALGERL